MRDWGTAFSWASAAAGVVAAALWFIASTPIKIKNPEEFSKEVEGRGVAIMDDDGTDVLETARRQTRWNNCAAIATGIAAALQAATLSFQH